MKAFVWLVCVTLGLVGCGDDTSCSVDGDCFQGEICTAGSCAEGTRANNASNRNNIDTNNTNNGNNVNNGGGGECVVGFGSTCEDDEFEDNDLWNREVMPTDQEAWCEADELVTPEQSWSGTLCAGDGADHFRMQIDNRSPNACLNDRFTIRITVEFEQTCDPENLRVVPYNFFINPTLNSICGERETVRCQISNEGRTYQIDWVMDSQQLPDPRLMISTDRDDVQLDYTVTMEIIQ